MRFRETNPLRTVNVAVQNDYKKYRAQLRIDFNCRCGYCDDRDIPRADRFEIDHFVPRKIAPSLELTYSNLVYACRSCNNAKRAKWPSNNPKKPNDGVQGWIEPCDISYSSQFERGKYGEIIAKTVLGKWMYNELKLWKPQHEILRCYEEIDKALQEIKVHYCDIHDEAKLKNIIKLYEMKDDILNKLYI